MDKATPYKTFGPEGAERTLAIVDYDSQFTKGIEGRVRAFNKKNPDRAVKVETHKASDLENLAQLGADKIIHTGGQGDPVPGSAPGSLYICHSHQFKAEQEGGEVKRLSDYQIGPGVMDVKEDDPVSGKEGKTRIEKYHTLAVTKAPKNAKVIATSTQTLESGEKAEIAEAIRYADGSVSVQGHPGGATPSDIIENYLEIEEEYEEAA